MIASKAEIFSGVAATTYGRPWTRPRAVARGGPPNSCSMAAWQGTAGAGDVVGPEPAELVDETAVGVGVARRAAMLSRRSVRVDVSPRSALGAEKGDADEPLGAAAPTAVRADSAPVGAAASAAAADPTGAARVAAGTVEKLAGGIPVVVAVVTLFDDPPKLTVGFFAFDLLVIFFGRLAAEMGFDTWASAVNPLADGDAATSTLVFAAAAPGWRPTPEAAGTTDSGGKPKGGGELAERRLFREGSDFAIAGGDRSGADGVRGRLLGGRGWTC